MGSKRQTLAEIRKSRGMTQKELALAAGVGESTIQLWESDTKRTMAASVTNLAKVAEALNVTIGDIIPA